MIASAFSGLSKNPLGARFLTQYWETILISSADCIIRLLYFYSEQLPRLAHRRRRYGEDDANLMHQMLVPMFSWSTEGLCSRAAKAEIAALVLMHKPDVVTVVVAALVLAPLAILRLAAHSASVLPQ